MPGKELTACPSRSEGPFWERASLLPRTLEGLCIVRTPVCLCGPLSRSFFFRPCPWTGSRAWSLAAQLRLRAQHLGAVVPPARRTWARKAEWPVGELPGWRPPSP